MKVLIAGGTGFIGRHAVKQFLERGDSVSVLTRRPPKTSANIQFIEADVTHPASLEKIISDYDVVVLCVQFPNHPFENPRKGFTYEKVDGEGTQNICKVLEKLKIGKIIYISGSGTALGKTQPWFKAKLKAESSVMDCCRKNGASYVILRPSWVYGPGDKSMSKFIHFAKYLPVIPVIGNGLNKISPLYIDDLAKVILKATDSSIKNLTVELGGPQILTMNEVQRAVLKSLGKKKPFLHHPLWLMRAVFPSQALDFIMMDSEVPSHPGEELFGFKFTSIEEGLSHYQKYA